MPFNSNAPKELRKREGLSGYELARILDVTPQTVYNWEGGNNSPTVDRIDSFHRLAEEAGHRDLSFYLPPKKSQKRR